MSKPSFKKVEEEFFLKHHKEIKDYLLGDSFAQHLGIRWVEWGKGRAVADLDVSEFMLNAHGTLHGGVIFTLADVVFAAACNSYGKSAVALSMNIGFLSPGFPGNRIRAIAEEVKRGGKTGWYRIQVENEEGTLVAQLDALAYRKNESFIGD